MDHHQAVFPSPYSLWTIPSDNRRVHAQAPWFFPSAYRSVGLINSFLDAEGWLPGGVPVAALETHEWNTRVIFPDDALRPSRPTRTMAGRRNVFNQVLLYKMELLWGMEKVPPSFNFDLWVYRTPEEAAIGQKLASLWSRVPAWRGVADYHQDALLWSLPRLPAGYQYLKKGTDSFWLDTVRVERRARARYGVLAQWHQPEVEHVEVLYQDERWVTVPRWFEEWEVPQGFWAELGPPLAYIGSQIQRDRQSGWWVVVLTNWVVEVWAYALWEAFDTWRLWWLPPKIREAVNHLNLRPALGLDGVRDAQQAVSLMNSIDWDRVPRDQRSRLSVSADWSVGRTGDVGDYVYVNPEEWRLVSKSEAKRQRSKAYGEENPFPRARKHDMHRGWDPEPRTFDHDSVAGPATIQPMVTEEDGTGIFPSGSVGGGTALDVNPVPVLPIVTAGVAHSDNYAQKQPQPTVVDPSDQDSTDEDEIVPRSAKVPERGVEVIVISSDSEPGTGNDSPLQEPKRGRGRKRKGGRSFRVFEKESGRVYLPRAAKKSAPTPKKHTPIRPPSDESEEQEGIEDTSAVPAATEECTRSPLRWVEEVGSPRSPSPPSGSQAGPAPRMYQFDTNDLDEIVPVIPRSPTPPDSPPADPTHQRQGAGQGTSAEEMVASPPENPQVVPMYESSSDSPVPDSSSSSSPQVGPGPGQPPASTPAPTEHTVDATDAPDVIPETVTPLTVREIQVVHRFCEQIMPTPDTGFAESGADLVRQLRGMIREHVSGLVRRRLEDRGIDPDLP